MIADGKEGLNKNKTKPFEDHHTRARLALGVSGFARETWFKRYHFFAIPTHLSYYKLGYVRGLNNYLYILFFGGFLVLIIVSYTPNPYSKY